MVKELHRLLAFLRPAFSRQATYRWFVVVFVGLLVRDDTFGVSSVVRALSLGPQSYTALLHFFHSSAWSVDGIMNLWWRWLAARDVAWRLEDRLVFLGDHTKTPKNGRKMPAVTTLHQDSETASKPSFFRGHHWGCLALLVRACDKCFATPLYARIHEGLGVLATCDEAKFPKTVRVVHMAQRAARAMARPAYLVLDAYFGVGSVFQAAGRERHEQENLVHVLVRAKKTVTAYRPAVRRKKRKQGRPRKYGQKLRLMALFDSKAQAREFRTSEAHVYDRVETIRFLALDLLWKPIKDKLRFILVESSRGRMVLITSDLHLNPVAAVEMYCRRVRIETLFDTLKNTLGGMGYHFWSRYLRPISRRPKKNVDQKQESSNVQHTRNTLAAIEKFVNLQLLVLGILQLIATLYPERVKGTARCWLRTISSNTPSEFVTRTALKTILRGELCGLAKDWIAQLIRSRQEFPQNQRHGRKVA
jgi:hypothetical protein